MFLKTDHTTSIFWRMSSANFVWAVIEFFVEKMNEKGYSCIQSTWGNKLTLEHYYVLFLIYYGYRYQTIEWNLIKVSFNDRTYWFYTNPLDTERKLNVHKTFKRRPGHLLDVLYTFNLRPMSRGNVFVKTVQTSHFHRFPLLP